MRNIVKPNRKASTWRLKKVFNYFYKLGILVYRVNRRIIGAGLHLHEFGCLPLPDAERGGVFGTSLALVNSLRMRDSLSVVADGNL